MNLFHSVVLSILFFPALDSPKQDSSDDQMKNSQMGSESPDQQSPQRKQDSDMQEMPGMEHGQAGMQMKGPGLMSMHSDTFLQEIVHHGSAGTSAESNSTPTPMLMTTKGSWMFMFHANSFVLDEQQSSHRGGDKFFSTNWFMPMAQRELGSGTFTARVMLSLEPATITGRRYPLLFQQGEIAFKVPIADGQHPHDFIMELAALYDQSLGDETLLSFYFAPMGDPAIGPTAYPHRASALENPLGTLGHHQEDSTHIADDVITVGLTYRTMRIEASGFHGREPDELRWDIDQGKIDSWATRLTVQPGKNWSGQYSYGRIKSPEGLFPAADQERMTASIMYNRPLRNGNWASTILWGRTRSPEDSSIFDSYLLESTVRFLTRNYVWTRIENAERSNELITGENPLPPGFKEEPIGRVQAYSFGYDHDLDVIPHVASAIGVQFAAYGVADALKPIYGSHPFGVALFVRLRPFSGQER
jgi:hypothetical protein